MEMLKRINFDSDTPPFSLPEFRNKLLRKNNLTPIRLNEIELKNALAVISLLQINSEFVKVKEDELFVLKTIISGNYNFLNNNLNYIIKLIPELDDCYKEEFNNLLNQTYDRGNLFDDEKLHNFCSEAIVDTIAFERLWEFGLYNVHKMSNEIFKDITVENRNEFSNQDIRTAHLSKAVIEGLKKMKTNVLDKHEMLLVTMFHYQISKEDLGMTRATYFGSNMLKYNMYYADLSIKIQPEMKTLVDTIITNEIDNNLNRNQGWTR